MNKTLKQLVIYVYVLQIQPILHTERRIYIAHSCGLVGKALQRQPINLFLMQMYWPNQCFCNSLCLTMRVTPNGGTIYLHQDSREYTLQGSRACMKYTVRVAKADLMNYTHQRYTGVKCVNLLTRQQEHLFLHK